MVNPKNSLDTLAQEDIGYTESLEALLKDVNSKIEQVQKSEDPNGPPSAELTELKAYQDKINDSLTKVTKYTTASYGTALTTAANMQSVKENRMITTDVLNEETAHIGDAINDLRDRRNNKVRMAEINTYYSLKYKGYASVAKLGSFLMIIILALSILNKNGLLPDGIYNIIVALIIVIGGGFILVRVYGLYNRDNMSFQEKEWSFDPVVEKKNSVQKQKNRQKANSSADSDGCNVESFDSLKRYGPI